MSGSVYNIACLILHEWEGRILLTKYGILLWPRLGPTFSRS